MSDNENIATTEISPLTLAKRQLQLVKTVLGEVFPADVSVGVKMPRELKAAVETLSRQLSDAERSSKSTQKYFDLLRDIIQKTAMISSSLDLEQVLERVMDTVIELTGANRAYLMLYDKTHHEYKSRIARNWEQASLKEQDILFSQSVIEVAITEATPIFTSSAQEDTRFQSATSVVAYDLLAILCIPMMLSGEVMGVIYADNKSQRWIFDAEMLSLLSTFANQAAIAINNARQFEQVIDDFAQVQVQVQKLQIEMNHNEMDEKVRAVTESAYFKRLTDMKNQLRNRMNGE
ncbi:MAG: GAF domain-containing protein [Phototrophicales bacterium]|nr:GAF domain-containing protein [Phototrophicales bacterium]